MSHPIKDNGNVLARHNKYNSFHFIISLVDGTFHFVKGWWGLDEIPAGGTTKRSDAEVVRSAEGCSKLVSY